MSIKNIYVDLKLEHKRKSIVIQNALIDTGSPSTIISAEYALKLGLLPEPTDKVKCLNSLHGIEYVYEKTIDIINLDTFAIKNFTVDIGAMQYGLKVGAIIGLDLLLKTRSVIDLERMLLNSGKIKT